MPLREVGGLLFLLPRQHADGDDATWAIQEASRASRCNAAIKKRVSKSAPRLAAHKGEIILACGGRSNGSDHFRSSLMQQAGCEASAAFFGLHVIDEEIDVVLAEVSTQHRGGGGRGRGTVLEQRSRCGWRHRHAFVKRYIKSGHSALLQRSREAFVC